jgi:hypothetical protein
MWLAIMSYELNSRSGESHSWMYETECGMMMQHIFLSKLQTTSYAFLLVTECKLQPFDSRTSESQLTIKKSSQTLHCAVQ